jgi:hypothetical protein
MLRSSFEVKFTLEQAMRAQRGRGGIYVLFLYPRRWIWGWNELTLSPSCFVGRVAQSV